MKKVILALVFGGVLLSGCSEDASEEISKLIQDKTNLQQTISTTNQLLDEANATIKDREDKIQDLKVQLQVEKKKLAEQQIPISATNPSPNQTIEADLNGDEYMEHVRFYGVPGGRSFKIAIDEMEIAALAHNIDGNIGLVDIDSKDNYREIIVSEDGPSSDEATYFYYVNSRQGNIIFMGKIQGKGYRIKTNGDGKVITLAKRGQILQTWFHKQTYELTSEHILKEVPQDLYEMNTKVTVQKEIPLYKSRTDHSIVMSLKPAEQATIVSSDDKEWCLVENSQGKQGWFAVDGYFQIRGTDYNAQEVFSGLNFAD